MNKVMVTIVVETKNGIVRRTGGSPVPHPEIKFKGGSIKWLDDSLFLKNQQ